MMQTFSCYLFTQHSMSVNLSQRPRLLWAVVIFPPIGVSVDVYLQKDTPPQITTTQIFVCT